MSKFILVLFIACGLCYSLVQRKPSKEFKRRWALPVRSMPCLVSQYINTRVRPNLVRSSSTGEEQEMDFLSANYWNQDGIVCSTDY